MQNTFSKTMNLKRFKFATSLILIICLSIFKSSCCKKDEEPLVITKEISEEINELIYFQGDEKASVVIVNAQSGPDTLLSTTEVDYIVDNFDTTGILIVNVHQAQTQNPGFVKGNEITLEQAVDFNSESVETLYQVIDYFKKQERAVYVLGASFGAFITQELIAKRGIDVADKYLIMTGRLDMNDIMWQGLAEGKLGYFENGVTPIIDPAPSMDILDRNLGKIAAGLGMNRYTQRLNTIGNLSNVTYVYGATDQLVGSLTAEEVEFLKSKNANVIKSSGGHDDTFIDFLPQGFKETFGIE